VGSSSLSTSAAGNFLFCVTTYKGLEESTLPIFVVTGFPSYDEAYVFVSAWWPEHTDFAHILVPQFVVLVGSVSLHVLCNAT
jgi:hypothetical protein